MEAKNVTGHLIEDININIYILLLLSFNVDFYLDILILYILYVLIL